MIAPVRLSNELAADFALLGEALEEYQIHFFSFSLNWILNALKKINLDITSMLSKP